MSDLVGNTEDRFSGVAAHMIKTRCTYAPPASKSLFFHFFFIIIINIFYLFFFLFED